MPQKCCSQPICAEDDASHERVFSIFHAAKPFTRNLERHDISPVSCAQICTKKNQPSSQREDALALFFSSENHTIRLFRWIPTLLSRHNGEILIFFVGSILDRILFGEFIGAWVLLPSLCFSSWSCQSDERNVHVNGIFVASTQTCTDFGEHLPESQSWIYAVLKIN